MNWAGRIINLVLIFTNPLRNYGKYTGNRTHHFPAGKVFYLSTACHAAVDAVTVDLVFNANVAFCKERNKKDKQQVFAKVAACVCNIFVGL